MKIRFVFILLGTLISFSTAAEEEKETAQTVKALTITSPQSVTASSGTAIAVASPFHLDASEIRERMRQSFDMQKEYLKVRLEAMAEPEAAALLAKFSRTYYEALIAEGFSERQAMQLVINAGIPRIQ